MALGEPGEVSLRRTLQSFDSILSSDLMEAEVRSVLSREGVGELEIERHLIGVEWIRCARRLTAEIEQALAAGYFRGADLWHIACALYASPDPAELAFLTLDRDQKRVAKKLGFRAK